MFYALIKIRFKQLVREFSGLGIFRFLFFIGLMAFLGAMVFSVLGKTPHKFFVSGIVILLVLGIHIQRRDRVFVKILTLHPFKVYFAEYLLLSLPLVLSLACFHEWLVIIGFIFGLIIISFIDYSPKSITRNNRLIDLIPSASFEWKAGIRKVYWPIIIIWLAGILGSFLVGVVPVSIVVITFIIIGFYQDNESVAILISQESGAKLFLWKKIGSLQFQFTILLLPLLVLFFVFHPQIWYIPVIEYVVFSFVFIYTVLLKYAFYVPGVKTNINQTLAAFGPVSILLPLLLPLVLLLSVKFYFNAKSNLKIYLDDYN